MQLFSAPMRQLSHPRVRQRTIFTRNLKIQCIPSSDKILLLGNFNARVGKNHLIWIGVIRKHGIGKVNADGIRLLSLCAEHDLMITNTIFQQKNKYKASWMHPQSKQWHLLDYVIVRRKNIKDMHIACAMRGVDCLTVHSMVISKMRVTVRPPVHLRITGKKWLDCAQLEAVVLMTTVPVLAQSYMRRQSGLLATAGRGLGTGLTKTLDQS